MVRSRTMTVFALLVFLVLSAGCTTVRNALGAARAAAQLATRQTTSFSLDDLKADCQRPDGAAEILMSQHVGTEIPAFKPTEPACRSRRERAAPDRPASGRRRCAG